MILLFNLTTLSVLPEPTIGQRAVDLLKAIAQELQVLGSQPIFWIIFTIIVFTMLVAVLKTHNADGIFNKIQEAFYDSVSLIISLFYDIIGVFSVVLNFIRTITEMLFGDLSENLLKRLFAFAIIAFSITSFSTTFEGMIDLFKWTAALVSFGVQILVLGLTYKLVLLMDDRVTQIVNSAKAKSKAAKSNEETVISESKPDKKHLYNKSVKKPLIIASMYTILPVLLVLIYLYYNRGWLWAMTVIISAFYILELYNFNAIDNLFKNKNRDTISAKAIDTPSVTKVNVLYFLLGLAIFVSSFFSYTSISKQFVNDQINTDYLIATSTRAVENLESMEDAMQETTSAMVERMNYLLNTIETQYTYISSHTSTEMTPYFFEKKCTATETTTTDKLKNLIQSQKISYAESLSAAIAKKTEIDKDIEDSPDNEVSIKREGDYETLEAEIELYGHIVGELKDFDDKSEYTINDLEVYMNFIRQDTYKSDNTKESIKEFDEYIKSYSSEINVLKEELRLNLQIEPPGYSEINSNTEYIQSFLQSIESYDIYNNDTDRDIIKAALGSIKGYISKYNDSNRKSDSISINAVQSLIDNLLDIEKYYSNMRTIQTSPKETIQDETTTFFSQVLNKNGNDSETEQAAALDASLEILQILFSEVVNYPNMDSVEKIHKYNKYKPASFVEIEQDVYVQIRTLNDEMKPFEKFLRKLFDRDAFPEMSVFALFIALLIDTAVVILFILRGKDGPYSDTKLNSKRVIYLHAVENNKTPKKMKILLKGTLVNLSGIIIGIIGYVVHKAYQPQNVDSFYFLVYIFAGLIVSNSIITLLSGLINYIKTKKGTVNNVVNKNHYDQYTLKYDVEANSDKDKFYDTNQFENNDTSFYNKKIYWRYIERLRERFLDTFVLFLCTMQTIKDNDRTTLEDYIKTFNDKNHEKELQLSVHSYVAWIDCKDAGKYQATQLLRSLLAYDHKIIIITNDKYYINNNFFKYINELLWSKNSQYSNYGLDYSDYDIDEVGLK